MLYYAWGRRVLGLLAIAGCALAQATPAPTSSGKTHQQDTIESLEALAFQLLSSVYPSTTVTNLATISWPSTLGVTSSSRTSTSSPSSTSSPTSTSSLPTTTAVETAKSPSSTQPNHHDRNLAIILSVVLGVLALAVFFLLLWLCRRSSRRSLFSRRSPTPLDETEYNSWRRRASQQQWHEKYEQLTPVPPPSRHAANGRYRYPEMTLAGEDPFDTTYAYHSPSNEALRRPQNRSSTTLEQRSPSFYGYAGSTPDRAVREIHPALMAELPGQSYTPKGSHERSSRPNLSLDTTRSKSSVTLQGRNSSSNRESMPVELPAENPFESQANTYHHPQSTGPLEHMQPRSSLSSYHRRRSTSRTPQGRYSYDQPASTGENPFDSPVYEYGSYSHESLSHARGRSSMPHHETESAPFSPVSPDGDAAPWIPPRSPHRPKSFVRPSSVEASNFDFGFGAHRADGSQRHERYRDGQHARMSGASGTYHFS